MERRTPPWLRCRAHSDEQRPKRVGVFRIRFPYQLIVAQAMLCRNGRPATKAMELPNVAATSVSVITRAAGRSNAFAPVTYVIAVESEPWQVPINTGSAAISMLLQSAPYDSVTASVA